MPFHPFAPGATHCAGTPRGTSPRGANALLGTLALLALLAPAARALPSPSAAKPAQTSAVAPAAAAAAPLALGAQRTLLLVTFGYLGGQTGLFLNKAGGAAVDTLMISFNSVGQCEFAENQLKERWRNDVINSVCMPLPDGATVH